MQAINRQMSHYSAHVGQIVLLAKHFRGTGVADVEHAQKTITNGRKIKIRPERQSRGAAFCRKLTPD